MAFAGLKRILPVVALFLPLPASHSSVLELTPQRQLSALLPSGPEKILVIKHCVMCHGGGLLHKRLEGRRGWSLRDWEDMVFDMIEGWGADIERRDIRPIAAYLTKNFGPGTSPDGEDLESVLPDGPAKALIREACLSCHGSTATKLRLEARAGAPRVVWSRVLARMQAYAPTLSEDEFESVTDYLANDLRHEPEVERSAMAAFYSSLPEGEGRDLIASNCLSCHGPQELSRRMESGPRGEYYWERTVRRMARQWEAPMDEAFMEAVIQYLNEHYAGHGAN